MEKMHNYCYDVVRKLLIQNNDFSFKEVSDHVREFAVSSMAGSAYAMAMKWLQNGMPISPEEMGALTMRLLRPGMEDVLLNG